MASMAIDQGPGIRVSMKLPTDRSPAMTPANAEEPPPAPNNASKPWITKPGASDANSAS